MNSELILIFWYCHSWRNFLSEYFYKLNFIFISVLNLQKISSIRFFAIHSINWNISKVFFYLQYYPLSEIPPPKPAPKGKYGTIVLHPLFSLFNHTNLPDAKVVVSKKTKTFEEMHIKYGYVLYETTIPYNIADPSILYVCCLRDRATVYVNEVLHYYYYLQMLCITSNCFRKSEYSLVY